MDVNDGHFKNAERRLLKHSERYPQFTRIDEDIERAEIRGETAFALVYQTHALACESFGWKINKHSYKFVERLIASYTRIQGWELQITRSKLIDPTPVTEALLVKLYVTNYMFMLLRTPSDPTVYASEQRQRKKERGKMRTLQRLILGKTPSKKKPNGEREGFTMSEGGGGAGSTNASIHARRSSKSEVARVVSRRLNVSATSSSARRIESDSESTEVNDIFDMDVFEEADEDED